MPGLPPLGPIPFFQLRMLYAAQLNEPAYDPLMDELFVVAPQWRFHGCTACGSAVCLRAGWRGLYWQCSQCDETGSVDAESHARLARLLEPRCGECDAVLFNQEWRAGNYLPCPDCEHPSSWRDLQRAMTAEECCQHSCHR